MRYALACLMLAVMCAVAAGCTQPAENAPSPQPEKTPAKAAVKSEETPVAEKISKSTAEKHPNAPMIDARFEKQLLAVGADYQNYHKLGEVPGWASMLCDAPRRGKEPRSPIFSASTDEGTHGRKMYYLWAKDEASYVKVVPNKGGVNQPVGQAIVKESYHPVEHTGTAGFREDVIKRDGKSWRVGEKYALFVMLKLDPATEGSDDGWIYATLSADGGKVTSSGIVKSCVGCHQDCASDRMFGYEPPKTEAKSGRE